ncbi:hypothetical protein ACWFOD_24790, partial [Methylorubrum thiocyanatum]
VQGLEAYRSASALDARREAWAKCLPADHAAMWDFPSDFAPEQRTELFERCAGLSVNAMHSAYKRRPEAMLHANRLAQLVGLDMNRDWRPTGSSTSRPCSAASESVGWKPFACSTAAAMRCVLATQPRALAMSHFAPRTTTTTTCESAFGSRREPLSEHRNDETHADQSIGAIMTSDNNANEFRRGHRLQLQMEVTPEQFAVFKEWSASVPTLYFLDICVVSATKQSQSVAEDNSSKSAIVQRLRNLDRPQHSFSYLLALMEKVSDTRSSLSSADLEGQILGDVAALRHFFKNARVQETDDFLINYTRELRTLPPELSRPNYLRYLEAANGRFSLKDPVAPALRLQKAKQLLETADAMSVQRQHPVVLLALACLYGNRSAKKMMKFKADPNQFNAENALADISVIGRFASFKLQIEQGGRSGKGGFFRSEFVTADDGLSRILPCFEAQVIRQEETGGEHRTFFKLNVDFERLLTHLEIGDQPTSHTTDDRTSFPANEFQQLCALLAQ